MKTLALTLALLATPAMAQTDPLLYTKATTTMRAVSVVCGINPRQDHLAATFEIAIKENGGDVDRTVFVIKSASQQIIERVRVKKEEQQFCEYAYKLYQRIYGQ
jgi:hypothetical protein